MATKNDWARYGLRIARAVALTDPERAAEMTRKHNLVADFLNANAAVRQLWFEREVTYSAVLRMAQTKETRTDDAGAPHEPLKRRRRRRREQG